MSSFKLASCFQTVSGKAPMTRQDFNLHHSEIFNLLFFGGFKDGLAGELTSDPVNQQTGRSNEVTKENGWSSKDATFQTVHPHIAAHEDIPGQHVRPFLRDKIWIIRSHSHKSFLRVATGIKDVVKLGKRCRYSCSLLDN